MAWGVLQVGALLLKETDILEDVTNANTGIRTVRLEGAETAPSSTSQATIAAKQADIMSLMDRVMPVQFERKSEYNGYYRFTDTNTTYEKWQQGPAQVRWSLAMELLGPDNAVDIESRLTNVARINDFSLAGERWHAPALAAKAYTLGTNPPASISRTGADGAVTVYRLIPTGVTPRWTATVSDYLTGRARVLAGGVERIGTRMNISPNLWELNNGLVKVTWAVGSLRVSTWNTAWRDKDWGVFASSSVNVTSWDQATVLRNDPEAVILRLVKSLAPGSIVMDLTLRRGSRFVEGYLQRHTSADELKVRLNTAEAFTNGTGYAVASANDANGNRFAVGSARTFTTHTNGGVLKTNTRALDFWLGAQIGATPGTGDDALAFRDQYIGAASEKTVVVRR